jgi:hypothetical protein
LGRCRDVKENHFIRTLLIVSQCKLNRVTHTLQATFLGTTELHTTSDMPIVDI